LQQEIQFHSVVSTSGVARIPAMPKQGPYLRKRKAPAVERPKTHNVREWREYFGWTQEDLAGRSGLSVASISAYERGDNDPSLDALRFLASAFDVARGLLLDVDPNAVPAGVVTFRVPPADHHRKRRDRGARTA
jgi:DNA-binding XRE family transcriptional regulator